MFFKARKGTNSFTVHRDRICEVSEAVNSLAVPHVVDVQMYSYRNEAAAFLDGGMFTRSGYNNSIFWIVGPRAVRLLCGRLGIAQPRQRAGEPKAPSLDELESELLARDWPALEVRLEQLLALARPEGRDWLKT